MMMIELIIKHSIAFTYLLAGSVSDIKRREVADWANYGLICIAAASNLIFSIASKDIAFIINSLLGLGVFLLLALIMFYTGQWGGGDSKMLMGLGALYGIGFNWRHSEFLVSFMINTLIAGALYGIAWSISAAVKNRKRFTEEFHKLFSNKTIKHARKAMLFLAVLAAMLLFLLRYSYIFLMLISLIIMIVSTFYLWLFVKAVENSSMYKKVNPSQLTEGDWIAEEVKYKGKYICGPKDLGIDKKQIEQLKKLRSKKKVLIKEGIPFVPSFLIGWVITVFFGNILAMLV